MMDMDTPMVIITRNKWTDTYFCPSLGWGKTTDAGISTETLQTAEVPIVEKSKCMERMNQEELEAGDENLLVCTGGTGVGPCKVEKKIIKGPVHVHRSTLLAPTSSRRAIDPIAFALWGQRERK